MFHFPSSLLPTSGQRVLGRRSRSQRYNAGQKDTTVPIAPQILKARSPRCGHPRASTPMAPAPAKSAPRIALVIIAHKTSMTRSFHHDTTVILAPRTSLEIDHDFLFAVLPKNRKEHSIFWQNISMFFSSLQSPMSIRNLREVRESCW